jgi:hypothetical protein
MGGWSGGGGGPTWTVKDAAVRPLPSTAATQQLDIPAPVIWGANRLKMPHFIHDSLRSETHDEQAPDLDMLNSRDEFVLTEKQSQTH